MRDDVFLALQLAKLQLKLQLSEVIPQLKFMIDMNRRLLEESEETLRDFRVQLDELKTSY